MDNKNILITSFTDNKTTLSNDVILENSFILTSTGENKSLDIKTSAEIFFATLSFANELIPYLHNTELVLVGCGKNFIIPSIAIKKYFNDINIQLEWMTTHSAIHTYNILVEDYRNFVALFFMTH